MPQGFIWYELITRDPEAAAGFYGALLGWTAEDSGQPGMDYRFFKRDGAGVGGLMKIPAEAAANGMAPAWYGYVHVPDVDATVARFLAAGGSAPMSATTLAGVGRMAMLTDPQGASLYVMTPSGSGESSSFAPGKPGHGAWHELHARDWEAALAFYGKEFGWSQFAATPMGAGRTYLQFNAGSGPPIGGMMTDTQAPRPHWLYVFAVEDIDAAHRRLLAHGGECLVEPHQVRPGDFVVHARDPQGARFALVGPRPA
jgi:predicted enzyme related to lactoylglutathione lyase